MGRQGKGRDDECEREATRVALELNPEFHFVKPKPKGILRLQSPKGGPWEAVGPWGVVASRQRQSRKPEGGVKASHDAGVDPEAVFKFLGSLEIGLTP
jgi:hypothetical protein